jgi:hypothetical protein
VGGGRTESANATKRSLAETGSARKVDIEVNVVVTTFTPALGLAEWAATHTVHFAESVPFG